MCDDPAKPTSSVDRGKAEAPPKIAGPVPSPKVCPSVGEGSKFSIREIIEFPWILRIIGPKHIAIARLFGPTMISYTVAGVLATIYFCDWKAVLQYLPFWNGKYKKVLDEKALDDGPDKNNVAEDGVGEKDPNCP